MIRAASRAWSPLFIGLAALGWLTGCAPEVEPQAEAGAQAGQVEQSATVEATWTRYISEEDGSSEFGGVKCPSGQVVIGVGCYGDYCDNVRLRCDRFEGDIGSGRWTNKWVEANGNTKVTCDVNEWMAGIRCRGDWCDDVDIWCVTANVGHGTACAWTTAKYSEEQGSYTAPSGKYIAGVECTGAHCDDKRYYVCEPRPAPSNSCNGRCGGPSTGGTCHCDSLCLTYDDCCADYALFCS